VAAAAPGRPPVGGGATDDRPEVDTIVTGAVLDEKGLGRFGGAGGGAAGELAARSSEVRRGDTGRTVSDGLDKRTGGVVCHATLMVTFSGPCVWKSGPVEPDSSQGGYADLYQ
jgi:hypothetical protein